MFFEGHTETVIFVDVSMHILTKKINGIDPVSLPLKAVSLAPSIHYLYIVCTLLTTLYSLKSPFLSQVIISFQFPSSLICNS